MVAAEQRFYTVPAAAKRVKRSIRTIRYWIAGGMATIPVMNRQGRVVRHEISEDVLLARFRESLQAKATRSK